MINRDGIGSLRRSQVVMSFGPGATIDLPEISVIIGGLDWWSWADGTQEPILEPRLAEKAAEVLGVPRLSLFAPPAQSDVPYAARSGIGARQFPAWFTADYEQSNGGMRSRPLVRKEHLVKGKYERDDKKYAVTPVRFVQACPNGHIADIEWYEFVHGGPANCRQPLWMDEQGTSGDLTDLHIRCGCGLNRPLAQAVKPTVLGQCKGQRPWLPIGEKCGGTNGTPQMMRLLVRTASNAYFAQRLSVLSLPDASDRLRGIVETLWLVVGHVETVEMLEQIQAVVPTVQQQLAGIDSAMVLEHIRARRENRPPQRRPIKLEEYDVLMQAADSIGEDVPEGDFFARRLALPTPRPTLLASLDRVVLVHRLREVTAQVGFTRFEAIAPDLHGELDLNVRPAAIASEPTWIPAVETRGEGVFLAFQKSALDEWNQRPNVRRREDEFRRATQHLRTPGNQFVGITYIMLHSLAHLLITAVALDCGYASSSIRERIYLGPAGGGILLYTGTTDAEGTLGGLVQIGGRIERYLRLALDLGRLCSNDPICAQHGPAAPLENRYTLGAACHGCLLISETCCERRNELLDRSLVVPTVEGSGTAFFVDLP